MDQLRLIIQFLLQACVETLTKERDEAREERVKRDSAYEQDRAELKKENQLLKKNVCVCMYIHILNHIPTHKYLF